MDQDETVTAGEPKREPILATLLIRLTIRGDEAATVGSYVPTNEEAATWVEERFHEAGYAHVNATAEKV